MPDDATTRKTRPTPEQLAIIARCVSGLIIVTGPHAPPWPADDLLRHDRAAITHNAGVRLSFFSLEFALNPRHLPLGDQRDGAYRFDWPWPVQAVLHKLLGLSETFLRRSGCPGAAEGPSGLRSTSGPKVGIQACVVTPEEHAALEHAAKVLGLALSGDPKPPASAAVDPRRDESIPANWFEATRAEILLSTGHKSTDNAKYFKTRAWQRIGKEHHIDGDIYSYFIKDPSRRETIQKHVAEQRIAKNPGVPKSR